jgi:hypothetical protein
MAVVAALAAAQPVAPGGNAGARPAPQRGPGPWDRDVLIYRASAAGEVEKLGLFERAGVPTLARMADGRLIAAHQHFPENAPDDFDKVAIHFSSDEGKTWTDAKVMRLAGLPEGMRFPFDPTLLPMPDGKVRMYFTSLRRPVKPPEGGVGGEIPAPALPAIHSAISENGINYVFEAGVRFGIAGRPVIDCAAALHDGVFHLFAPDNGQWNGRQGNGREIGPGPEGVGYHATSKDGLNFTRVADVRIEGRRHWLGNALSDGKWIYFLGTGEPGGLIQAPPPQRGGVWLARSADGAAWELVEMPSVPGADAGIARGKEGGWIILTTGPNRAGTASAVRERRGQRGEEGGGRGVLPTPPARP